MRIKVNINIEKKYAFMILAGILLLGVAVGVYGAWAYTQQIPNPGHGGDSVWINIPEIGEKTLQQAINEGNFAISGCNLLHNSAVNTPKSKALNIPSFCINKYCKIVVEINEDGTEFLWEVDIYRQDLLNKWSSSILGASSPPRKGTNGNSVSEFPMSVYTGPNGGFIELVDDNPALETSNLQWSFTETADDSQGDPGDSYTAKVYACIYSN